MSGLHRGRYGRLAEAVPGDRDGLIGDWLRGHRLGKGPTKYRATDQCIVRNRSVLNKRELELLIFRYIKASLMERARRDLVVFVKKHLETQFGASRHMRYIAPSKIRAISSEP